jgi:single-stranded DNA-binding protein
MLNQVVLVGKAVGVSLKISEERLSSSVTMEIERSFRNPGGDYEKDYLEVKLTRELAEQIKLGALVGIKGRLTPDSIVAEKVSILGV